MFNTELPSDSQIPLLGKYPEGLKTNSTGIVYTWLFIAALFITAKKWKPSKRPSSDEWMNESGISIQQNYYSGITRTKVPVLATTWRRGSQYKSGDSGSRTRSLTNYPRNRVHPSKRKPKPWPADQSLQIFFHESIFGLFSAFFFPQVFCIEKDKFRECHLLKYILYCYNFWIYSI